MNKAKAKVNSNYIIRTLLAAMLFCLAISGCVTEEGDEVLVRWYERTSFSEVVSANSDWSAASASQTEMNDAKGFPLKNENALSAEAVGGMDVTGAFGGKRAYIVAHTPDSILVLDMENSGALLDSFTVGSVDYNAYDVLVISPDKAYVSRQGYGYDDVLIMNPQTGERTGSIDFSAVAGLNADGLARPADMIMVDDSVYVALQNLDVSWGTGSTVIGQGIVAVVDPHTDTIETTVALSRYVPYRLLYSPESDTIFVANAGRFGDSSWTPHPEESALEVIRAYPPYATYEIVGGDTSYINGNIKDVAVDGRGRAWLLVAENGFIPPERIVRVDAYTGAHLGSYPETPIGSEKFSGIVHTPEGFIAVGDQENNRILVMDSITDAVIGSVPLSLPPVSLAVVE